MDNEYCKRRMSTRNARGRRIRQNRFILRNVQQWQIARVQAGIVVLIRVSKTGAREIGIFVRLPASQRQYGDWRRHLSEIRSRSRAANRSFSPTRVGGPTRSRTCPFATRICLALRYLHRSNFPQECDT